MELRHIVYSVLLGLGLALGCQSFGDDSPSALDDGFVAPGSALLDGADADSADGDPGVLQPPDGEPPADAATGTRDAIGGGEPKPLGDALALGDVLPL